MVVDALLPFKRCGAVKTITTDNGPEFVDHEYITRHLGAPVYFADPYSSWQKGFIENTNMLIRQYIPRDDNREDNLAASWFVHGCANLAINTIGTMMLFM